MQVAIMRSAIAARIRADAFASSRQRLDLGSIFGAKHSQVALPQWSVTAPLAIDPRARAGSSRLRTNKEQFGSQAAAAAVAGREDEGATLYWLVLVNERMRWLGWGRRADAVACGGLAGDWGWSTSRRGVG